MCGKGLAVAALVAGLAELLVLTAMPRIVAVRERADLAVATSNLKQLGVLMSNFDQDWGSFPSRQIRDANPDQFVGAAAGDDANAYLGMLLAGGYTQSEELFVSKRWEGSVKRPDCAVAIEGRLLLEPGRCGFGYVMLQGGKAMCGSDEAHRPLLVAPLEVGAGGQDPDFDRQPYAGLGIYLRLDQSVQHGRIDPETRELPCPQSTCTLFQAGPGTIWGGDEPDVKAPR